MANKKKDKRKIVRSSLTGKVVNGREVIMTDEAIEYVKKQGYKVLPQTFMIAINTYVITFIMLGAYILG